MLSNFEFMKNGQTVFVTQQDLGIIAHPNPFTTVAFQLAVLALDDAQRKNSLPADAGAWDQVKINGHVYGRPQRKPPLHPAPKNS